jgi:hypothetical protein
MAPHRESDPRGPPRPHPHRFIHGVKGLPLEEERSTAEGSNSTGQDPFQIQISQSIRATVVSFVVPAIPSHTHSIPLPTNTHPPGFQCGARQIRGKARIRAFFFRARRCHFFSRSFFFVLFFGFARASAKAQKKFRRPLLSILSADLPTSALSDNSTVQYQTLIRVLPSHHQMAGARFLNRLYGTRRLQYFVNLIGNFIENVAKLLKLFLLLL